MRSLNVLITVAVVVLAVPSAWAAAQPFKVLEAKKACLTGNVAKGIEILADLYLEDPDPVLIYNQGRCYEQNNQYPEAIAHFREYLRKAMNATAAEKTDAEKHIADCQALLADGNAGRGRQVESAKGGPVAETSVNATENGQGGPRSPGHGLRIAGIATGAVGIGALATGIVFNLKVNSMVHDLDVHFDKEQYNTSQDYKTIAWIGYGAGTALVAGGVAMYFLGWRMKGQGSLALTPLLTNDKAGALLMGSF